MKVIIEGQLLSLYKKPDFTDKETGEKNEGKNVLQLLVESQLSNGSIKHEMQDVSIPKEKVKEFEPQIGKTVQVKCEYMSKSQVSFYVK